MRPVTDKQKDTLRFIFWFNHEKGYMPSTREIAAAFRIASTNAVADRLRGLQRKGCLTRESFLSRAMRITDHGMQVLGKLDDPWPFFDVEKSA